MLSLFFSSLWQQRWQDLSQYKNSLHGIKSSIFIVLEHELSRREVYFSLWREPGRLEEYYMQGGRIKWKSLLCLVTHLSSVKSITEGLILKWCVLFTEQVLLDQNVQTPPPSPFSIQAFSKGTSCSNGQGFDYGLGNNKGMFIHSHFFKNVILNFVHVFITHFLLL